MFRNIVLSGGAAKGFCFVGCIKYLQEHDMMKDVKNIICSSVGSIFGLIMALKYPYSDLKCFLDKNNKQDIIDDDFIDIYHSMCLCKSNFIIDPIEEVLESIFSKKDVTFLELIKYTNINLVIVATNLTKKETEFFSVDTFPNMNVIDAVKASFAIPLIFKPIIYNDNLYCDASIYNHIPYDFLKTGPFNDTLVICLESLDTKCDLKDLNIFSYLSLLTNAVFAKLNKKNVPKNCRVLKIIFRDENLATLISTIFENDKKNMENLIEKGFSAMENLMLCNDTIIEFE